MTQSSRALILLLAMLWQMLAWVTPYAVSERTRALAHVTVHGQELDHHHHADASLHMADEVDSDKHLHPDSGAQSFGLHPATERLVFAVAPGAVPLSINLEPPSVVLDGWLRPPQALS